MPLFEAIRAAYEHRKRKRSRNRIVVRLYAESDYLAIVGCCLPERQAIYTSLPIDVIESFRKDPHNRPYVIYCGDRLVSCFVLYAGRSGNPYMENEKAAVSKSFSIKAATKTKGTRCKLCSGCRTSSGLVFWIKTRSS